MLYQSPEVETLSIGKGVKMTRSSFEKFLSKNGYTYVPDYSFGENTIVYPALVHKDVVIQIFKLCDEIHITITRNESTKDYLLSNLKAIGNDIFEVKSLNLKE